MPKIKDLVDKQFLAKRKNFLDIISPVIKSTNYIESDPEHQKEVSELAFNVEAPPVKDCTEKQVAKVEQKYSKGVANREQTDSKLVAKVEQKYSKGVANREQTDSKLVAKVEQTGSKEEGALSLKNLIGIQYKIILFFYFLAKREEGKHTGQITHEYIANHLEIGLNVTRNAISRLQKKGYIKKNIGKIGRGGWTVYELVDTLYNDLMQQDNLGCLNMERCSKGAAKVEQKYSKGVAPSLSSSRSSIYNITSSSTNNNINTNTARAGEWQLIDYSGLADIGFGESQLAQLSRGHLTREIVQDSIDYFAFDLKHNRKGESIKGDHLNYFMGMLSKDRPYNMPPRYKLPEEERMEIYIKDKKKKKEEFDNLTKEAREEAFEGWYRKLTDEDKDEVISKANIPLGIPPRSTERRQMEELRKHFYEHVWPELCRKQFHAGRLSIPDIA